MKKTINNTWGIVFLLMLAIGANAVDATDPTNLIVDFQSTIMTSHLNPGDNGNLNLVIENSGGFDAEEVNIWVHSDVKINIDKRFYVGIVKVGESKVITTVFSVNKEADSGLAGITVTITYDGYDPDGRTKTNQVTAWELPVTIYGEPLFQITPSKTTYGKDTVDDLVLSGFTKASVKDLETVFSSKCIMVVGSSKQYVGDVAANSGFAVNYTIKPTTEGSCSSTLQLFYNDAAGSRVSNNVSLGLVVGDAGVDFKVADVSYDSTGPGKTTTVKIRLNNVGLANAEEVTLDMNLTSPFAPVDTAEKYVGEVRGNRSIDAVFNIAIGGDAATGIYLIPLVINYKVGGTSYKVTKDIGIDVSGTVILEVTNVAASRGTIQVDVVNIGTRSANSVKATLITGGGTRQQASGYPQTAGNRSVNRQNFSAGGGASGNRTGRGNMSQQQTQSYVAYKSDIKPTKQTTFTFSTSASGSATLILEYTGLNNERVRQVEQITLSGTGTSGTSFTNGSRSGGGTDMMTLGLYGLAVLVVGFVAYKLYKRRKSKNA